MPGSRYDARAAELERMLKSYEQAHGDLPGIRDPTMRTVLIQQIIDSERRVDYFRHLLARQVDPDSWNPRSSGFDPIRAAIVHRDRGDLDEAMWMVFLFVHFGKHSRGGWRYSRDVYGRLGAARAEWWTWKNVSDDPLAFRYWLDANQAALRAGPAPHGFSNHRKYESLNAWDETGTGAAVESYVNWVESFGGDHKSMLTALQRLTPEDSFDALYRSVGSVQRFGRIAQFDYATTVMKLELAVLRPPHSYLIGSTGPLRGARLLFTGDTASGSPKRLQSLLSELSIETGLGADVLEDAVCNWQKNPSTYVNFSG